jgi:glutaminyl-tRNA synthetase
MPTLTGLRRRGFPAEAIRDFSTRVGVAKANSTVEVQLLEHCVRERLNQVAPRRMAVLRPLRVVIENYDEGAEELLDAANHPNDPGAGTRRVPFGREIFIERDDFMEDPPKKFFRLGPGREVRLRFAYFITCTEVVKNAAGEVDHLICTYDPATRGGDSPDGRKVRGTLHWVSVAHGLDAEVRLYDYLFKEEFPATGEGWLAALNPKSLTCLAGCKLEPALAEAQPGESLQFERLGYFCADTDGTESTPVFNRTMTLRDSWAKAQAKG